MKHGFTFLGDREPTKAFLDGDEFAVNRVIEDPAIFERQMLTDRVWLNGQVSWTAPYHGFYLFVFSRERKDGRKENYISLVKNSLSEEYAQTRRFPFPVNVEVKPLPNFVEIDSVLVAENTAIRIARFEDPWVLFKASCEALKISKLDLYLKETLPDEWQEYLDRLFDLGIFDSLPKTFLTEEPLVEWSDDGAYFAINDPFRSLSVEKLWRRSESINPGRMSFSRRKVYKRAHTLFKRWRRKIARSIELPPWLKVCKDYKTFTRFGLNIYHSINALPEAGCNRLFAIQIRERLGLPVTVTSMGLECFIEGEIESDKVVRQRLISLVENNARLGLDKEANGILYKQYKRVFCKICSNPDFNEDRFKVWWEWGTREGFTII